MRSLTVRSYLLRSLGFALLCLLPTLSPLTATAHHSAALFYSMEQRITLSGEVIRFNFRNPHAIVELAVTDENGEVQRWICETSAPSALRRRGWSQQSLEAGERVTMEGVPALDGSLLMRITSVTRADGTQVGVSRQMDD